MSRYKRARHHLELAATLPWVGSVQDVSGFAVCKCHVWPTSLPNWRPRCFRCKTQVEPLLYQDALVAAYRLGGRPAWLALVANLWADLPEAP